MNRRWYYRLMGKIRDAARTRTKIMEAARDEFAAHGLAGARIEAIARRAGLSKQLLYHYFPSKEVLFQEILEHKFGQLVVSPPDEKGPGALFRGRFASAAGDPVWVRFMTWEAAERAAEGKIAAEAQRRALLAGGTEQIAAQQAQGVLPAELPTELLQLAIHALALYPLGFPQMTRMITGKATSDPEFQEEWAAFLDDLARRIARPY
ncbi:TetR family transcriptional regulator (plasmid) [Agrobacterium tumefaciens]|uniref:TetR/AcrR family transcriptional regulator n=1 Tax=Agrobacterium tumefaciens TaxID=358 RepID=UPI001574D7F7|nr:TetR/AcrR family transcriptional regulator [Agrobacterium tumefaciens]WCA62379.1 TetR family transcriptional regulator [Agrobacterium tumefaciens]